MRELSFPSPPYKCDKAPRQRKSAGPRLRRARDQSGSRTSGREPFASLGVNQMLNRRTRRGHSQSSLGAEAGYQFLE